MTSPPTIKDGRIRVCWWQLLQAKENQCWSVFNSREFSISNNQIHYQNPWNWNACILKILFKCQTRWSNQNYYNTERKYTETHSLISNQSNYHIKQKRCIISTFNHIIDTTAEMIRNLKRSMSKEPSPFSSCDHPKWTLNKKPSAKSD